MGPTRSAASGSYYPAMDFDLSANRALQDAARQLLDDQAGSERVRAHLASGEPYDRSLWEAMVDQGWPAVAVPEAEGGLGLGWVEARCCSKKWAGSRPRAARPPADHLGCPGRATRRRELAGRLMAGEALGAVAWTSSDATVERSGDGDRPRSPAGWARSRPRRWPTRPW